MLQHVEKALITVGARRVLGSGPSFLQQHRQVGVGKEWPGDGDSVARAALQDSKNAVSGLKPSRANDRNADVLLDLGGSGCIDTLDHLWDRVPLLIEEMLCARPAKLHQPAPPRVSHEQVIPKSVLPACECALVSFPGHVKGKRAGWVVRVRERATRRDMDGASRVALRPLGNLYALLQAVASGIEIVE